MVDYDGPASRAYKAVMIEAAKEIDYYIRMKPDDELSFYQLLKVTAYERAARIINDCGVISDGNEEVICQAIKKWLSMRDGLNFATWDRHLGYSMDIVRKEFSKENHP